MKKIDVQEFHFNLENNIFEMHERLKNKTWLPDKYTSFYIRDPKLRHIHKATVRDRVFNQALFRVLYPIFDRNFIFDSYSCRKEKGVHKGVLKLEKFLRMDTNNYRGKTFALKCDVRKFFDSISHEILFGFIKEKVKDNDVLEIIKLILDSFETKFGKGLPLGNVTSQLFANIYLNKLDQFMKHNLKIEHYLRYCDDFIILSKDKNFLIKLIPKINAFLQNELSLGLHPKKVEIRKNTWGVDFLGYIILPHYKVIRTKTKIRIMRKIVEAKKQSDKNLINNDYFQRMANSYRGVLSHCKGYKIVKNINSFKKMHWIY
ncbi:MAG: Retron-type reverse transcriptase [Candidatus Woesebacteria bacterium GW2011_GWA1_39_8]|uniref:Retron-type reverse transcriptase n=1 Tax=Candidatus Woesebacteria bacterium GW2011_GWA1_39_8 TaxID=1618552 RepID=A0A0G0PLV9_9BACT|nr:MAG: Retron-type reverse transcriptase [Candidatus Woesebacteria bacterium GW2011_GWA1_39_8]